MRLNLTVAHHISENVDMLRSWQSSSTVQDFPLLFGRRGSQVTTASSVELKLQSVKEGGAVNRLLQHCRLRAEQLGQLLLDVDRSVFFKYCDLFQKASVASSRGEKRAGLMAGVGGAGGTGTDGSSIVEDLDTPNDSAELNLDDFAALPSSSLQSNSSSSVPQTQAPPPLRRTRGGETDKETPPPNLSLKTLGSPRPSQTTRALVSPRPPAKPTYATNDGTTAAESPTQRQGRFLPPPRIHNDSTSPRINKRNSHHSRSKSTGQVGSPSLPPRPPTPNRPPHSPAPVPIKKPAKPIPPVPTDEEAPKPPPKRK
jgi:hypothetical protein